MLVKALSLQTKGTNEKPLDPIAISPARCTGCNAPAASHRTSYQPIFSACPKSTRPLKTRAMPRFLSKLTLEGKRLLLVRRLDIMRKTKFKWDYHPDGWRKPKPKPFQWLTPKRKRRKSLLSQVLSVLRF